MRKYKDYIHIKGKNIPIPKGTRQVLFIPEDAFYWQNPPKTKPLSFWEQLKTVWEWTKTGGVQVTTSEELISKLRKLSNDRKEGE